MAEPTEADTKRAREWLTRRDGHDEGCAARSLSDEACNCTLSFEVLALASLLAEVREEARRQGREEMREKVAATAEQFGPFIAAEIRDMPLDGPEGE